MGSLKSGSGTRNTVTMYELVAVIVQCSGCRGFYVSCAASLSTGSSLSEPRFPSSSASSRFAAAAPGHVKLHPKRVATRRHPSLQRLAEAKQVDDLTGFWHGPQSFLSIFQTGAALQRSWPRCQTTCPERQSIQHTSSLLPAVAACARQVLLLSTSRTSRTSTRRAASTDGPAFQERGLQPSRGGRPRDESQELMICECQDCK